ARAICLWRLTVLLTTRATSLNSLRAEQKRPLPPGYLGHWLLTARTICLSRTGSTATFLSLLLAECEPHLPPDSLQLWLSSQAQISATGLAPSSDFESVILATRARGAYTAVLRGKVMTTGTGLVEIYDVDQNPNTQITNLSARGFVGTGDDAMIGGTIFRGSPGTAYRVLVRAIGPSLANMGVATPLLDPALSLHDANGNVITTDDNWKD